MNATINGGFAAATYYPAGDAETNSTYLVSNDAIDLYGLTSDGFALVARERGTHVDLGLAGVANGRFSRIVSSS